MALRNTVALSSYLGRFELSNSWFFFVCFLFVFVFVVFFFFGGGGGGLFKQSSTFFPENALYCFN